MQNYDFFCDSLSWASWKRRNLSVVHAECLKQALAKTLMSLGYLQIHVGLFFKLIPSCIITVNSETSSLVQMVNKELKSDYVASLGKLIDKYLLMLDHPSECTDFSCKFWYQKHTAADTNKGFFFWKLMFNLFSQYSNVSCKETDRRMLTVSLQ